MLTGKVWGDKMKIYRKGFDKWALTSIIRQTDKQTDRISLFLFSALNFILPYKGRATSFFCFGSSGVFRRGCP